MRGMRIEIIGGMGVGKTTLCNTLTSLGFRCINENLGQNPYLDLAYQNPDAYGLYSQLTFYLGNFFSLKENTVANDITVFDYSVVTDRAYATMFLEGQERDLALQAIDCLETKEGRADLYLYLTCSPTVQLQRIRARNRDHEKGVQLDFIAGLDSHLRHYAAQAAEQGAQIITIDTEDVDLLHDTAYIAALGDKIRAISGLTRPEQPFQPALDLLAAE